MPFEPVDEAETRKWEPCRHPEHDPPAMIVITKAVWWVCPGCGRRVLLRPTDARYGGPTSPRYGVRGRR